MIRGVLGAMLTPMLVKHFHRPVGINNEVDDLRTFYVCVVSAKATAPY